MFLNFLATLLEFLSKNYEANVRSQFLHSTLNKFSDFFATVNWADDDNNKEVFEKLREFLENIINGCQNIKEILALEPFLQFVQYLPSGMKKNVCKKILSVFSDSNTTLNDPLSVHALLSIAKSLNDDYGFSLEEEEKKAISNLVKKLVSNVDYGKDVEQMLNFYTEVRAYFGNLPGVLDILVENFINDLTLDQPRYRFSNEMQKICQGKDHKECVLICSSYHLFQLDLNL